MSFQTAPIGALFDVKNGATPKSDNQDYWSGDIPWLTPADLGKLKGTATTVGEKSITEAGLNSCGTQIVPVGALVLSIRAPIGHLAIASSKLCFNQGCRGLVPRKGLDGKFAYWTVLAAKTELQNAGQGTTFMELSRGKLRSIHVSYPDLPTQKRIAAFLDRETARIDELIAKKERLVDVITAKEIVVRDTFVTKGVSDHEMKPSGVDWFGDVPRHWTVCRFNRLISSKVDYRGRTPEKVDDGVFLVTARNIRNGIIDYERSQEFTTDSDWAALSARGLPEVGDILFTTEAPLGQIAQVDRTDVAFAQRIIKFRAKYSMVSNDFLAQLMMTSQFQRSLQLYSSGSTAAGIKSERMAHLFGLVPPKAEQDQIVESLRAEITRLAGLVNPIRASIDRLREYRAALITAAVTGQIDVDTYGKTGATSATLDQIEEEMQA